MRGVGVVVIRRVRKGLRRLGVRRRMRVDFVQPADQAWREMMARAEAADAERRLAAAESALNGLN